MADRAPAAGAADGFESPGGRDRPDRTTDAAGAPAGVVGWVAGEPVPSLALDAYLSSLACSAVGARVGVDGPPAEEAVAVARGPVAGTPTSYSNHSKSSAVRAWAVKGLLADRLFQREASRLGVTEPASSEAWLGALTTNGEVALAQPGDAEVLACYRSNLHRYRTPEARRVRHLLVADKATAERLAKEVVAAGDGVPASLAELAALWSLDEGTRARGGELGWVVRGRFAGAFEEAVFGACQGELCGPVESGFGWHLFTVESVRSARLRPFEECREEIIAELVADGRRAALRQWWGRRLAEAVRVPPGVEHPMYPGLPGAAHRH